MYYNSTHFFDDHNYNKHAIDFIINSNVIFECAWMSSLMNDSTVGCFLQIRTRTFPV